MKYQSTQNVSSFNFNVAGLVLAGGLARRFNQQDKGLVMFKDQALINYALQALEGVASPIIINANRNLSVYKEFGFQVITDADDSFSGPLAGVLSGMRVANTEFLLVVPCDCPLISADILRSMIDYFIREKADCCIPFDGQRSHPVFMLVKTALHEDLADYLGRGERKIDRWLQRHRLVQLDVSDQSDAFINVNSPDELRALELRLGD